MILMARTSHGPAAFLGFERPESVWLRRAALGSVIPFPTGEIDGEGLLALADLHRLGPRIGSFLAEAGSSAGSPWSESLIRVWRQVAAEQALVQETLATLGAAAQSEGFPVLALKGADLAFRLYRPGQRPSHDLDLLVFPEALERAQTILKAAGFRCVHPRPVRAREHWFSLTFRHQERPRLLVDLHWGLGTAHRTGWDLSSVFDRAEPCPGFQGLQRMDPADLLVYLALHAVAFHGAQGRWLWWLDLRLLSESMNPSQRLEADRRAREVGGWVALEAARRRTALVFGSSGWDPADAAGPAFGAWRAEQINRLGRRLEHGHARTAGRWLAAALAVDQLGHLPRILVDVLRRSLGGNVGKGVA